MELEAHRRDQISWACSAQDSKLLPKTPAHNSKKAAGEKIKQMVSPLFEKHIKARNEARARKKEANE